MVRRQGDEEVTQESPADGRPTCYVCGSAGPFGRALECQFKMNQQDRRHKYILCKSQKCEAKFEKECLAASDKGCEYKVSLRIKQDSKKGKLYCPQCFWEFKDVPLPTCEVVEAAPPPPPLRNVEKEKQGSNNAPPEVVTELEELDFSNCVVHVKDSSPAMSPVAGAKKGSKKGKKQANKANGQLAHYLFFDETHGGKRVTEEGEILPEEKCEAPIPARSSPAGAYPGHRLADSSPPFYAPTVVPQQASVEQTPVIKDSVWSESSRTAQASAASKVFLARMQSSGTSKATEADKVAAPETDAGSVGIVATASSPKPLPPHWKSAFDPDSKEYYYYNTQTKAVTWDDPRDGLSCSQEDIAKAVSQSSVSTTSSQASTACTSGAGSQASTNAAPPQSTRRNAIEYVCIRPYAPTADDVDCIRLTHGERVVLESETLSGWGIGTVILEEGEAPRSGHFPRWALSVNPAPEAQQLEGTQVVVNEDFDAPAAGYLSLRAGEKVVVQYQKEPFIWAWVESPTDPSRRGWVPEAVLRA